MDELSGILIVNKPSGMTSHDVVDCVRRQSGIRGVGHCGTLDPMATGLLILVMGKATKWSERLMGQDKEYEGTLTLGVTTSSQDADGEILNETVVPPLTPEEVQSAFQAFKGDSLQTPPMVSARKINGVPLYKLARKGQEVERKPRLIHVYRTEVLLIHLPNVDFRIRCTKGTYIRTICHDLGTKIGCGGHLSRLHRTQSGSFRIETAFALSQIQTWKRSDFRQHLIDPLSMNLP